MIICIMMIIKHIFSGGVVLKLRLTFHIVMVSCPYGSIFSFHFEHVDIILRKNFSGNKTEHDGTSHKLMMMMMRKKSNEDPLSDAPVVMMKLFIPSDE